VLYTLLAVGEGSSRDPTFTMEKNARMHMIALGRNIRIKIPPVMPGEYRISRRMFHHYDGPDPLYTAYGRVRVAQRNDRRSEGAMT
jgi:hypothetical protein